MSKFSNLKLRYKIGVGVATGAVIVAGGGAAFAYLTNTGGSGTGSASTGSQSTRSVTVSATETTGAGYDGTSTPITVTVSNANPYSVKVASVGVVINTSDASWGTATCPTDSFQLTGALATGPWTLAATTGSQDVSGTLGIKFVDHSGENQDGCIGFTVPLTTSNS